MQFEKVLLISHDTIGLGHFRRSLKIANHLASQAKDVLILCSAKHSPHVSSSPNLSIKVLPGYSKNISGDYAPRNPNAFSLKELIKYRQDFFSSTIQAYQPDLLISDQKPLGVHSDFEKTLIYLKKQSPKTKVVCGFRDILDERNKLIEEWKKQNISQALLNYYSDIWIYGEKEFFDFENEYNFSPELKDKTTYLGYIQSQAVNKESYTSPFKNSLPTVCFTVGGGDDSRPILKTLINMFTPPQKKISFNSIVVCGPYAPSLELSSLIFLQSQLENLAVYGYVDNLLPLLKSCQAVVSMGGYNSLCEALSLDKKPIVISRIQPRSEQLIRANIFAKKGLCEHIPMNNLSIAILLEKIEETLLNDDYNNNFEFNGLINLDKALERVATQ